MAHISLFLFLSAAVLIAIMPQAQAQEVVHNYEIGIHADTDIWLRIYDRAGCIIYPVANCDPDIEGDYHQINSATGGPEWRGDFNGDCPSCEWEFVWQPGQTELLTFEFSGSNDEWGVVARYVYVPAYAPSEAFYIPSTLLFSPDIAFYAFPNGIRLPKVKAKAGGALFYEDVFAGSYVLPYDLGTYYAQEDPNIDWNPTGFFLSPVDYVPTTTSGRTFTFAAEGDSRIRSEWSPIWDMPNLELKFPQGRKLVVEGDLDADGVTFTDDDANQGWGGLRVESGGAATLRGGSLVQDVKSFGGAAVTAFGDFTLDNSRIIGSALGAGADGIYASGFGTFVHVKNQSEISLNEGDGIYANLHAQVLVEGSTIDSNSGDGVSAYKADVFLYDSVVEDNAGGYGANAVYLGDIAFGWSAYSTPTQNNDLVFNATGTLAATSNSDIAAGTASGTNAQNNFIRDGSELHAFARTSSDVRAQCDWWGSASGPNLSFVDTDGGSTYTYDPFLTAPGGSCGIIQGRPAGGQSAGTSEGTSARGGPEAIPPLVWEALQAADAGETEVAFGLLVSAVETAATPEATARAYTALTRLARRGPSPGLAGFLSGQSQQGSERPWALAALVEVHRAADNAEAAREAATALTAEYAGTEHALFGWVALFGLAVETGDAGVAAEALAAAEVGWPEAEVTAMLRREHALRLDAGGGEGAQGAVAGRSGEASSVSTEARGAATGAAFALYPAYPNPSSGAVTVPLVLPEVADVSVAVFDVLGRQVAVLADGRAEVGRREFVLDGGALPAGLYVVRATVRTDSGTARAFSRRVSIVR